MPSTRPSSILGRLTALSDATRCRILRLLEQHELTVGELCAALQLPQSTVSRHLRVLSDENWVSSRGEGTSRFYKASFDEIEAGARDLWTVVRDQLGDSLGVSSDNRRAEAALAKRRAKVRLFFDNAAENWDELRAQLVGDRTDLIALLALLDDSWVVGDLGCGTGHIAEVLSGSVGRVIAIDESGPMLAAARERLAAAVNVELREGHIESLPLEDASLDVAVMFLVAHFIVDPARAMQEVRRVLKPGGRLLIVDLMPHDHEEYVAQLGHVWRGFDAAQITDWLSGAGLGSIRYQPLSRESGGKSPSLFTATARRPAA
jgi:ubiquinone/menaquinone biosynthesis C-methylase UbiE/DNA-binding transcriptional ArsR family regulator